MIGYCFLNDNIDIFRVEEVTLKVRLKGRPIPSRLIDIKREKSVYVLDTDEIKNEIIEVENDSVYDEYVFCLFIIFPINDSKNVEIVLLIEILLYELYIMNFNCFISDHMYISRQILTSYENWCLAPGRYFMILHKF